MTDVTPAPLREPLLRLQEVTIRFGGLVANDEVNLEVAHGAVAALIGPNGAGKTTMFNVVTGALRPTSGEVFIDGQRTTGAPRRTLARLGVARTFQNLDLVDDLTALENVTVGLGRYRRFGLLGALVGLGPSSKADRAIRDLAYRALEFVGLAPAAEVVTGALPYGDRRRVEIARALALGPRLLILDEPSAGMGPGETAALATIIQRARRDLGITVLVVEHDMAFVRAVADTTTVLELGRVIASGDTASVLEEPRVIEAYLGRSAA